MSKADFYIVNLSNSVSFPANGLYPKVGSFILVYSCYSSIHIVDLGSSLKCCKWLLDLRQQTFLNNYTEFFIVILV